MHGFISTNVVIIKCHNFNFEGLLEEYIFHILLAAAEGDKHRVPNALKFFLAPVTFVKSFPSQIICSDWLADPGEIWQSWLCTIALTI